MIVLVDEATAKNAPAEKELLDTLGRLPGIEIRVHRVKGAEKTVTEVYLIGDTHRLALEDVAAIPGIERVFRVSEEYRVIGRHKDDRRTGGFTYNGVEFSQDTLHVFAGLCAVDSPESVSAGSGIFMPGGMVSLSGFGAVVAGASGGVTDAGAIGGAASAGGLLEDFGPERSL